MRAVTKVPLTPAQGERLLAMRADGATWEQLEETFGASITGLKKWEKKLKTYGTAICAYVGPKWNT